MKFNLQFFADEDIDTSSAEDISTGAEESEIADPMETEDSTDSADSETEPQESAQESAAEEKPIDANAIAAAARRQAEQELKEYKANLNARFAQMFGKYTNPKTGKPISSAEEYADAFEDQERQKVEKQLKENGVNPELINELVNNSPAVKRANEVIRQQEEQQAFDAIAKDVGEIAKYDSAIKSYDDVPHEVVQYAIDNGYTLLNAYKILYFDKITPQKEAAIRQNAINQAKGKAHLAPVDGVATTDNLVDIPANVRGLWDDMFPDKTYAEKKKLYNEQL